MSSSHAAVGARMRGPRAGVSSKPAGFHRVCAGAPKVSPPHPLRAHIDVAKLRPRPTKEDKMQTWYYRLPPAARALIAAALVFAATFGVAQLYALDPSSDVFST